MLKDAQLEPIRELEVPPAWEAQDRDHLAALCNETVQAGHSVLVFCASKQQCEVAAKLVAKLLTIPERTTKAGAAMSPGVGRREWVAEELKRLQAGAESKVLGQLMACGVAYHHAGLTNEERVMVETAYK